MKRALVVVLLTGCANAPPISPEPEKPALPTADELACLEALKGAAERFTSSELTTCERDSDCRGVSALLSGQCGTVVNVKAFEAHLAQFEAQTKTCAPVVQVVPRCLKLQPVCRAQRCTAEPVAELPDECAELRAALEEDASSANTCSDDAQCTLLEDRPTTVAFAAAALDRREKLARACGTVEPDLFVVSPPPVETFCLERRCVSGKADPKFTTVVRDTIFVRPEPDVECIKDAFLGAFDRPERLQRKRRWDLKFTVSLDTEGRMNQFEFLEPANLSPAAQRAFAWRLHQCKAKSPALRRGKPVAIRYTPTIRWIGER